MKILVLGHKGMLGTDLMWRLGVAHEVTGKDVGDFDITSPESCRQVITEIKPDVVINAAAYTNVDGAEKDGDACFAVNAEGVRNVALACEKKNIRIVHFSTDYVFDGTKGTSYLEDNVPSPRGIYAQSKAAGEKYLQEYCDNYLLIRTAWLYGRSGKNFVKTILGKARQTDTLRVVDDQTGSPTYSRDLAAAVQVLLEQHCQGIFHVTNRGSCTWHTFAKKILEYAGLEHVAVEPIQTKDLNLPASRPAYSVLGTRKFTDATGNILRFWQLALRDYIEHTEFRR
ncbi:MAG TPA: dTDP-4-dehydrorhamnose reductase [Syntrophus sp. (in: bacteria)]|jgi:dTDP-4-dehydrorhamnose reductase|nr:dTDP-4-dehydrorhamnose reductase [Syntrophus sp. (in: bacteria)]